MLYHLTVALHGRDNGLSYGGGMAPERPETEHVIAGRAALPHPHPLASYQFHDFCMQCPTPSCTYR